MADTYTPVLTDQQIREIRDATLAPLFARAIERAAIEAYQRRQWISVEDRLPPAETDVLVKVASKQGPQGFDVAGIFHERWMSQATEGDVRWPVTHWMPLPPAPEGS
jgi:hypothetical protein